MLARKLNSLTDAESYVESSKQSLATVDVLFTLSVNKPLKVAQHCIALASPSHLLRSRFKNNKTISSAPEKDFMLISNSCCSSTFLALMSPHMHTPAKGKHARTKLGFFFFATCLGGWRVARRRRRVSARRISSYNLCVYKDGNERKRSNSSPPTTASQKLMKISSSCLSPPPQNMCLWASLCIFNGDSAGCCGFFCWVARLPLCLPFVSEMEIYQKFLSFSIFVLFCLLLCGDAHRTFLFDSS